MSLAKLNNVKNKVNDLIDQYDKIGILGPISYLEDCIENLDAAIEEYEQYKEEQGD
jgi:hypothetical protein